MDRILLIEPVVIPECSNNLDNWVDEVDSYQSSLTKDADVLTIVSKLDLDNPIDQSTLNSYSMMGKKVMKWLGKSTNDHLDFSDFKKALEGLNIHMMESRVESIFNAAAIGNTKTLTLTDLEIAFMINDVCPVKVSFNSLFEIFSTFDIDNCGELNFEQFKECVHTLSYEYEGTGSSKDVAYLSYLFRKTASSGRMDFKSFSQIWCKNIADVKHILRQRGLLMRRKRSTSMISYIFTCIWINLRRREILLKEMTKSGYDDTTKFISIRKQVVDLRLARQNANDKMKRETNLLAKRQKRKTTVTTSTRKKEMSLILRGESKRTQAMMGENRMIREKLLKDCEDERLNMELMHRLKRHDQINNEMKEIHRNQTDRIILHDRNLDEVPRSLYSDQQYQSELANVKILDISRNHLEYLPESDFFFHLISVRKLCLSKNKLKEIPDEISCLRHLEIILADENSLTKLPLCIEDIKALQLLDLSSNKLKVIQDELCSLSNLRVLKLHSNQLTKLSELTGNLKQLQYIDLSNNKLCFLPSSFCSLDQLVIANFSKNCLSDLPLNIGLLKQLEEIDLAFNKLQLIPESMKELKKLKLININHNFINEISDYVEGLMSLESFEGSSNHFAKISPKLGSLCKLIRLYIPSNQLKKLPIEIGLLRCLLHLNLRNNQIQSLPVGIGSLDRLQSLDASHNQLISLPHELCLAKSLIWINFSHNALIDLPKYFGALYYLKTLKVSNNKLTNLPQTFHQLVNLEELDLSSNKLQEIHIQLCEGLISLRQANFASNRIERLPKEIATMEALEELNLKHNRLKSLPLELTGSIIKIDLSQNPLDDLPIKLSSAKNVISCQSGYTLKQVNDFMVQENIFYKSAVDEWTIKKDAYISGKFKFDGFRNGVIWRCNNIYTPEDKHALDEDDVYLEKRLKQFFFHCKKYGNPPVYVQQNEEQIKEQKKDTELLQKSREERSNIAKGLDMKRRSEESNIYFSNLNQRCNNARDKVKQVQEQKIRESKRENENILIEVTKRIIEKNDTDENQMEKEKTLLAQENRKLNAVFCAQTNKKRFLPIEVKACWKGEGKT